MHSSMTLLAANAQKVAKKHKRHIAEAVYSNSTLASMATVAIPPNLAKVMSRLVEIALIPFGANFKTNCVDGALLHASPAPTKTEDNKRKSMFSLT